MRVAFFGLLAAATAICTACSPAVGSPEWCKQFQEKMASNPNPFEAMTKLTPEEQKGLEQCMANALQGLGQ